MPSPTQHHRAPLLWLFLPLMAGLMAARIWPLPVVGMLTFLGAAVCAGITAVWAAYHDRPGPWIIWLLLSAGLTGYVLLAIRYPGLHRINTRPPREITVTMEVRQTFSTSSRARSYAGLGVITAANPTDQDLIGCRIYYNAIRRISLPPQPSGRYVIQGVLEPLAPEEDTGGFNNYLINLGIRDRLTRAQVRHEVSPPGRWPIFCHMTKAQLERMLRLGLESHADILSLYLAMLLGDKGIISSEQEIAFMRSGTFHLFSISGLHVGVIATALHGLALILRIKRRISFFFILPILWLYVQITGAGPPAVRAFLMVAFLLGSKVFRLPGNALATLTASALLMLLLDPIQLFSTGFQMSYSVVTGLIVMGAPLTRLWQSWWHPFALLPKPDWRWWHTFINWSGRKLVGMAAGCWVAFLASAPAGIGFFNLFSPGSLLANLIIIPLASLAIVAGFLSMVSGLGGLLPFSALFNSAAALCLIGTDWILRQGTSLPGAYFNVRFRTDWLAPTGMVCMIAVMLAGSAGGWSHRYGGYWPPFVMLVLLVLFGVRFD